MDAGSFKGLLGRRPLDYKRAFEATLTLTACLPERVKETVHQRVGAISRKPPGYYVPLTGLPGSEDQN